MIRSGKTARSITAALWAAAPWISALFPLVTRADFFIHHWEDHYEPFRSVSVEGDFHYYMTDQNYGTTGLLQAAPNSDSYNRQEVDGLIQVGLLDRFSIFGRLAWARAATSNAIASTSTVGLVDQSAGMNFRVYEGPTGKGEWIPFSFDLQAQADFPAYGNGSDDLTRTPYLGDQSLDVTVGAFFDIPFYQDGTRAYAVGAGAGYTHRSSHFSSAAPWTISAYTVPKTAGSRRASIRSERPR